MRDRPTDWTGGLLLILGLAAIIILPQLAWYLVTGEAMQPDVSP